MSLFAPTPGHWHMAAGFRPFTWMEANTLAACIYPESDLELAELAGIGITLLVNLHERAHSTESLERHGLRQLHLPVPDLAPPTVEQIQIGITEIGSALAKNTNVVVHCAAGLGRTGTLLACYYVQRGLSAERAIDHIRTLRPGSIESAIQVQAIHEFARLVE
ncbi:MAG: dual specificity protein phosphatase family protein [Chloroflexota bacterium]